MPELERQAEQVKSDSGLESEEFYNAKAVQEAGGKVNEDIVAAQDKYKKLIERREDYDAPNDKLEVKIQKAKEVLSELIKKEKEWHDFLDNPQAADEESLLGQEQFRKLQEAADKERTHINRGGEAQEIAALRQEAMAKIDEDAFTKLKELDKEENKRTYIDEDGLRVPFMAGPGAEQYYRARQSEKDNAAYGRYVEGLEKEREEARIQEGAKKEGVTVEEFKVNERWRIIKSREEKKKQEQATAELKQGISEAGNFDQLYAVLDSHGGQDAIEDIKRAVQQARESGFDQITDVNIPRYVGNTRIEDLSYVVDRLYQKSKRRFYKPWTWGN